MSKRFYVTTAIDYVNGQPHLGHAYEKILTDVIARAHRSFGDDVFFLTGLDEHGQKVQEASVARGMSPQAYCDALAVDWTRFTERLNLTNNGFIRTTDPRHEMVVRAFLSKLEAKGDFYKATYEGYYSTKEETFLTEKDRREDGSFDPSWGEVIRLVEDNFYFRMGRHQAWLIEHIETNPDFVAPDYRRNEVLGFLKNNKLADLCITRPAERLNWGIPLPFAPEFVTYVWFDALLNYVSLPGMLGDPTVLDSIRDHLPPEFKPSAPKGPELWPADIQVIGKDILRFHAVYWPIMLKAMELPLPRQVLVHGWWRKDGQRISKSTGNVVDPLGVIDEWGVDAFRYYVVRELGIGPDGNWTDAGFEARYQAELANGLGNLVNRSLSMLKRYRDGMTPPRNDELAGEVVACVEATTSSLRSNNLQGALQRIWRLINRVNQYVDQTAPFKLAKDPEQSERLGEVLYNLAETCRILAVLLWPFLPDTARKIYAQLGVESSPDRWADSAWGGLEPGHVIQGPKPLFPRRDLKPKNEG